jgi:hypothetical protein
MCAAQGLTLCLQGPQGIRQLSFGALDVACGRENLCAPGSTEGDQRTVGVAIHEPHHDFVPLREALEVTDDFERQYEVAARLTDRLERSTLARGSRRHRFVEMLDSLIDATGPHHDESDPGQASDLEIRVVMRLRQHERQSHAFPQVTVYAFPRSLPKEGEVSLPRALILDYYFNQKRASRPPMIPPRTSIRTPLRLATAMTSRWQTLSEYKATFEEGCPTSTEREQCPTSLSFWSVKSSTRPAMFECPAEVVVGAVRGNW